MIKKKANLNMLAPAMIALTLGAIILVFGLLILDDLEANTAGAASGSVTAEVITQAEITANTSVTRAGECRFGGLSVSVCTNASAGGVVINSANYTVGTNYITNKTGTIFTTASWYCNYTYTYGGEACNAANSTIRGIGEFGDYYDLIVLAVVIAIVISLLLIVFNLRKTQ